MKWKNLFLIAATIIILGLTAVYVYKNIDSFKRIMDISANQVCVFIVLQFITVAINAVMLLAVLHAYGVRVSFQDGLAYSALNTFLNYISIKGGVVAKGYFLKKIHRFSYTDFAVSMGAMILMHFMVAGITGAGILILIYIMRGNANINLFLVFGVITAVVFSFIKLSAFHNRVGRSENYFLKKLYEIWNSWKILSKNRTVVYGLSFLIFLNFVVYAFRLKYGFHIFYEDVSFLSCMLISILGVLSTFVALTPASLGIREFAVGAGYRLIEGDMLQAVVVTGLDRAVSMILVFSLGAISCVYFLKRN
ncbi:MAG: hypothetical protein CMI58_01850 [Parcubacteria group bacterium]|nr:hypothetical protein [Parcubacteria group bacterium]